MTGTRLKGATTLEILPVHPTLCPDCPAVQTGVLHGLVSAEAGCSLQWVSLKARQPIPARWPGSYSIALVRRGAIVRQRVDGAGHASAVDAIGVGGGFVVNQGHVESTASGYAATASLVCLCPAPVAAEKLANDGETAKSLWALAESALERVERIADARGRPTTDGRIAALLGALADTLGGVPRDFVPAGLQQRDLAALVSVRPESVCRSLKAMTAAGLIRKDSRGIHLVDRPGLAKRGGA